MTSTAEIARVGEAFPEVTLPRLDGGSLSIPDQRGKRLLLFFWGSW